MIKVLQGGKEKKSRKGNGEDESIGNKTRWTVLDCTSENRRERKKVIGEKIKMEQKKKVEIMRNIPPYVSNKDQ